MNAIIAPFGQGKKSRCAADGNAGVGSVFIALVLIRLSGRRSFGQRAPFEYVVVILLGATLSLAVVGASLFFATVIASLMIAILHRLLARACR